MSPRSLLKTSRIREYALTIAGVATKSPQGEIVNHFKTHVARVPKKIFKSVRTSQVRGYVVNVNEVTRNAELFSEA